MSKVIDETPKRIVVVKTDVVDVTPKRIVVKK